MSESTLEIIVDDGDRCGEGPMWDFREKRLLWTDIPGDVVYEWRGGKKNVVHRGTNVSTIALARDGLVFGGAVGLWKWTRAGGCKSIVAEHAGEALAINDMIADASGRIYAGTVYWGAAGMEKRGKIYLISPDGVVKVVEEGIELANGMGFSVDGRTLYFADSAQRRIYAYDVEAKSGEISRRRIFAQLAREDGLPDGLTVDGEDHVWCAFWYGGKVMRFDPEGKVQRKIDVPAIQTSSVAFGGDQMEEIYITTATEAWPSDLAPAGYKTDAKQGGALYRLNAKVRGKHEHIANF